MVQCGNPSGPAKGSANSEVYAVLLGSDGAEPVRSRSSKTARRCVAVGWSLLVTLAVALVTVVLFQLWATWHLHNKVLILQAQIDSMSALDLEELRSQLRDLYDLRDFSNAERDALDAVDNDDMEDVELEDVNQVLRGHPTSADEDQESDLRAQAILSDFGSALPIGKKNVAHDLDNSVEDDDSISDEEGDLDAEEDEDEEEDKYDDDDDADDEEDDEEEEGDEDEDGNFLEDPDDSTENLTLKRERRQVDLSSHTQDGIPIFDQGYGVAYNRTEGLRIYQSLLATGGRGEPRSATVNWSRTDAPNQPQPQRQNNVWRKKARHHSVAKTPASSSTTTTTTAVPDVSNIDLFVVAPRRNAQTASVEFRHSRVKASSGETTTTTTSAPELSTPSPVQGDQTLKNALPTPGPNAIPVVEGSATSVASKPKHRGRQGGAFKVSQSELVSTNAANAADGVQATTVAKDRLEASHHSHGRPLSSRTANHHKKRVNKKQLRDLPHLASAVHLVADASNGSSALDNQVEVASRNELGLHTSWKLASWNLSHRTPSLLKIDGATLTVKQSGLYFIYAQVHYLDEHAVNAYEIFVNTEPFLRCVTTAPSATLDAGVGASASPLPKANTCYTAGATHLREGDKLFLRDIEPMRYSVLQPSKTFFGLIRMAAVPEFP